MTGVYSAYQGENCAVFAQIMALYVPRGSIGCDVTYGRGTFWQQTPQGAYTVHATDLRDGTCLSALPYADASLDFHVLDPPYSGGLFHPPHQQAGLAAHSDFAARYAPPARDYRGLYYHAAVEALYRDGLREAARVLRPGGVQITKTQDEIENHRQYLTHCYVVAEAERLGFEPLDLFVVVRRDAPHLRRVVRQEHARKNHSYFLVFRLPARSLVLRRSVHDVAVHFLRQ